MSKVFLGLLLSTLVLGCTASKESDDLNKAQICLDKVPQNDPTEAQQCMQYVEKYTSQSANILKCSIQMTAGGLVESKVLAAYNALKDNSQTNKTAAFMSILSLNLPTIDAGLATAKAANEYCSATGVQGLMYISSVIVAGTAMNQTLYSLTGSGVDITDPTSVSTAMNTLITKCAASPPDPACVSNLPTIGAAVVSVSTSYCAQSNADQTVCGQLTPAVASAGSDPAQVGQATFCYLQQKTYNPNTQACQ